DLLAGGAVTAAATRSLAIADWNAAEAGFGHFNGHLAYFAIGALAVFRGYGFGCAGDLAGILGHLGNRGAIALTDNLGNDPAGGTVRACGDLNAGGFTEAGRAGVFPVMIYALHGEAHELGHVGGLAVGAGLGACAACSLHAAACYRTASSGVGIITIHHD